MRLEVGFEMRAAEEKKRFTNTLPSEDTGSMHFVVAQLLKCDEHVAGKRIQWRLAYFRRNRSGDGFAMKCDLAANVFKHAATAGYFERGPSGLRRVGAGKDLARIERSHASTNSSGLATGWGILCFLQMRLAEMRADSKMVGRPLPGCVPPPTR